MLDVRFPIGGLFFILGIMIAGWGYSHPLVAAIRARSGTLPINWDISWGIFMTIFGIAMFSIGLFDNALTMERQLKEEREKKTEAESASGQEPAPAEAKSDADETAKSEDSAGQPESLSTGTAADGEAGSAAGNKADGA